MHSYTSGVFSLLFILLCIKFSDQFVYTGVRRYQLPGVNFTLADAEKTDVLYHIFSKDYPNGKYLTEETVAAENLNVNLPTKFVIHGWLSNETTYWYEPIRDAYFKKHDCYIVYIDWSKAGSKDFEISAANSKPIGEFIADFIVAAKFNLKKVHIIGHSLGSHVAGFIGKSIINKTSSKLARITGTDPGGPMFESPDISSEFRLSDTDAQFVDVIHTDVGNYGFVAPIGMIDYYPNGGSAQPGCPPLEIDDNCSHARSNLYFIESINSMDFVASTCESWESYKEGNCIDSQSVTFGENVLQTARGIYYFFTNDSPPFAQIPNENT